ncbi:hypothetical protein D9758_001709 [Tetrapyrgos nigripes]|uniref:Calcineurin-like phosphoesterase domain-containing protein n=1 Tax=Tetrapyrgos nigripes TaxID=182062 RepID=A0A8H5LXA8_9AGAR|nr:hypothetical protein D9758_001709 [Tetrapyrgos nigripes]
MITIDHSDTTYAQPALSTPTSRVYTAYRTLKTPREGILPPHPGTEAEGWTRFVCISDTHSFTAQDLFGTEGSFNTRLGRERLNLEGIVGQIPPGDILLHAGDLSSWGHLPQLRKTVDWIRSMEGYEYKVIIAGNHDLCLDPNSAFYDSHSSSHSEAAFKQAQEMMRGEESRSKGIVYLEFEKQVLKTRAGREWKFYGCPAAPRYADGSFQYSGRTEAKAVASRIPNDVEILLTHTPAYGILDQTKRGKNAGCKYLLRHLDELSASSTGAETGGASRIWDRVWEQGQQGNQGGQLMLHVFGHIHEARGAQIVRDNIKDKERIAVNAAMLSLAESARRLLLI